MKKTILLLVSVITISTSFAQFSGKQDKAVASYSKDYGYNKGTYLFTAKDKDMQIAQINKNYDAQIRSVKSKLFMNRIAKSKKVDQLQAQRQSEINAVNAKFYDKKNLFNQQGKKFDDRKDDKRHNW